MYKNKSMCLRLKNKSKDIEVTLDLNDALVRGDMVIINPDLADEVIRLLKKHRIIRKVISTIDYNHRLAPIVKLNIGILKAYDFLGVRKYQSIQEVSL